MINIEQGQVNIKEKQVTPIIAVRNYLKTILPYEDKWFGIAIMDSNHSHSFSLYGKKAMGKAGEVMGIGEQGSYSQQAYVLLMRWGTQTHLAEQKKEEIWAALMETSRIPFFINGNMAYLQPLLTPKFLGIDRKGIYEYAFDFQVLTATA